MSLTIKDSVLRCFQKQFEWKRDDLIDKVRFLSRSKTERKKLDQQVRKSIKDLQEFHFPKIKNGKYQIVHTFGLEKDQEMIYKVTTDAKEINEYCDFLHRTYVEPIAEKIEIMRRCGIKIAENHFEVEQEEIDLNREFGH